MGFNAIALIFLTIQIFIQNKQLKYNQLDSLHEQLISIDLKKIIYRLYNEFELNYSNQNLNFEERLEIEYILNTFDLIGYRIKKGILPKNDILATEWRVIHKLWQLLEQYITDRRKNDGDNTYKEYFDWLNKETTKYMLKNNIKDIINGKVQKTVEPVISEPISSEDSQG